VKNGQFRSGAQVKARLRCAVLLGRGAFGGAA
jgi:hypothetical protein